MTFKNKQLLIVSGTKRNIEKTSLIEKILTKFSSEYDIISLKVKTLYPGDNFFHGKDRNPLTKNEKFRITEEKNKIENEDSNRMLNTGATKVFKIKTKSEYIEEAFINFINLIDKESLIICESNSIRKHIIPGIFLFIKEKNSNKMKPSAREVIKYADKIIITEGNEHNFNVNDLIINNSIWELKV